MTQNQSTRKRRNAEPIATTKPERKTHKWQPNGNFKGLGLLVIDYIQLIKGKGNNFEVLSAVANDLKQVAKDLDVHVLALAQIDRKMLESEGYPCFFSVVTPAQDGRYSDLHLNKEPGFSGLGQVP